MAKRVDSQKIKIIDCEGRRPCGIATPCPLGCGRNVYRLVMRWGRLGCMRCQCCYMSHVRNKSIRRIVSQIKSSGSLVSLSDRSLILLAGLEGLTVR